MHIRRRSVVSTTLNEEEVAALENWCTRDNISISKALATAVTFTIRNQHLLKEQQA
jgi:hypothetical protein